MLATNDSLVVRLESMKVRELMQLLAIQDPEAEVSLVSQWHSPVENTVAGLVSRAQILAVTGNIWRPNDCTSPSDVLITEGAWRRYGHQETWNIVARSLGARPPRELTD